MAVMKYNNYLINFFFVYAKVQRLLIVWETMIGFYVVMVLPSKMVRFTG